MDISVAVGFVYSGRDKFGSVCNESGDTYLSSVCTPTERVDGALLLVSAFGPKVRGSRLMLPLVLTGLYQSDIYYYGQFVSYPLDVTNRDPRGCDA